MQDAEKRPTRLKDRMEDTHVEMGVTGIQQNHVFMVKMDLVSGGFLQKETFFVHLNSQNEILKLR